MSRWFKFHQGTHSDQKFRAVARKSGQPIPVVLAIWVALLEEASANEGDVSGFDHETVSVAFDLETLQVVSVTDAMKQKQPDPMIIDDRIANWEKRQYIGDHSTERVRKHREKKAQKSAASFDETLNETFQKQIETGVTVPDTDSDTETERKNPLTPKGGRVIAPTVPKVSRGTNPDEPDWFKQFWDVYPRRVGVGGARSQFTNEIMFKGAKPEQMVAAARAYARLVDDEKIASRFIPMPQKWLSDQRYLDPELQVATAKPIDTTKFQRWHESLAMIIGDAAVAAWFADAEMDLSGEGPHELQASTRFKATHISNNFSRPLKELFGKDLKITVNETGKHHDQAQEKAAG
ncbi:MAG: hypothetical protein JWO78_193 [Micavibrio sp.]|nr:hypothetical protein [Micavibrio sp.]